MESDDQNLQPLRFRDPRQLRLYHRLSIVGEGPASFYRDACQLRDGQVALAALTHFIAHSLREVESALRDVLLPYDYSPPDACQTCENRPEGHKKEIEAIAQAYGFDERLKKEWIRLVIQQDKKGGLARYAHRDALARTRDYDDQFEQVCADFDYLLEHLLDKFEAKFAQVFPHLDLLLLKDEPTREDVKWLKNNVPSNFVTYSYFFDKLSSHLWLAPLKSKGFFKHLPREEYDSETKSVSFSPWPQSRYLARMANIRAARDTVLEIAQEIAHTNNFYVRGDVVEVALALPAKKAVALLPMIQPYDKLGDLVAHLAQDGQEEQALALVRSLCSRLLRAETPFDVRQCEQILRKNLSVLVAHDSKVALEVFCDVLDTTVNRFETPGNASSSTWLWRAAIEDHEQNTPNGFHGPKDILVSFVRDATKQAVEQQSVPMEEVVLLLERRSGRIFRRLALYILSQYADLAPDLVTVHLTDRTLFDDPDCRHEYTLLAHAGFVCLSKEAQDTVLGWVENGPDVLEYKALYEEQTGRQPTEEMLNGYTNHWRRDWLARLGPDLQPEWQQRYQILVSKYGPAQHPEFVSYMSTWVGAPASTLSREDLRAMSVKEIISYLKSWQPSPSSSEDFMNPQPSREGLGHMLTNAIEEEPERFAQKARQFRGLDATYVSAILVGFENAARQKRSFPWAPVLDLCFWVIQRQVKSTNRKRVASDLAKQWDPARKSITHLLSLGFESGSVEIPIDLHFKVWEVLQPLTEDEDPTPDHEAHYSGPTMEPFTLAMNTIRGEAMEAVIRYALWFRRHKEQEQQDIALGLDEMPNVRDVLNRHLDPQHDPSLAIRSVYGRMFPQLVWLDSLWVTENASTIFSREQTNHHLRDAAWEAFIIFSPPYNNVFDILRKEYMRAIELIGTFPPKSRHYYDPDQRLAEHLITFYCRGKVEIDDRQGMLSRFFTNASEVLRKHMLEFVGRDLYSMNTTKQAILPDALPRLQVLWEWRVKVARQELHPHSHTIELSAFGWWFGSGMFDEDWAIRQLEEVLKLRGTLEALHLVIERLVSLSITMPLPVVKCVNLLIQSDQEKWAVYGWDEKIRSILINALQSSDKQAIQETKELTNRLVLYGYTQFLDLLS